MNKYVIPAILGIVVLVAAAFAFAPVQKAQTVHSSLSNNLGDVICDGTNNLNDGSSEFDPQTGDCTLELT